jgi:hypothetical protein
VTTAGVTDLSRSTSTSIEPEVAEDMCEARESVVDFVDDHRNARDNDENENFFIGFRT